MADVYAPGASDINITKMMESYGYYPTQEEAQALQGSFTSDNNAASKAVGASAVAQYVLSKKAEAERQKNDPLVALQKKMDESVTLMKNQVQGLQTQLSDTLSAAPQLFGSLTPDQIQQYLAPLKTSFDTQLSTLQTTMASRGLGASSTENNALAQTGQKFKEDVLATGLQVGQTQQTAKAKSIQDQINNLFGLTSTEEQISAGAAGQKSAQDLGQSNLVSSLPYFLSQDAYAKEQARLASSGGNKTGSMIAGGLTGAMSGAAQGFMVGGPWGAVAGGAAGGALGAYGASQGGGGSSTASYNPSNALFLASQYKKTSTEPNFSAEPV